jgi:serine/threonine protein kinase
MRAMRDDASVQTNVPGRRPPDRGPVTDRGVAIGDVLGKCLLIDLIGRGGSCTVFRALHQGLNLPVAVKVLPLDASDAHRSAHEDLRREARLLAQLPHPHIVRVYDFEDSPALPYLVLECVEGPSLNDLIQQSGRLALGRTCEIVGQITEALSAMWKLGAVHRDVKPGNILLDRNGNAKLADFGQAILVEELELASFDRDIVSPDDVCGTPAYVAPEQFLTPPSVDHRADIYALGAAFYQAVTGQLPFEGRSRLEVLMRRTREDPRPPHRLVPGLSPDVSDVILTMMARDPADRYQNADELRDAVGRLSDPPPEREAAEPEENAPTEAVEESSVTETDTPGKEPVLAAPRRRSFWSTLLAGRSAEPPRPTTDEWMRVLKRTLGSPAARKRDE